MEGGDSDCSLVDDTTSLAQRARATGSASMCLMAMNDEKRWSGKGE